MGWLVVRKNAARTCFNYSVTLYKVLHSAVAQICIKGLQCLEEISLE